MKRPLIYSDLPDPDVIYADGFYYMVSTTMHMFPGGDIYRSRDLISWELCCHMYDRLDGTLAQRMEDGSIYGQGMWAACIRHHAGLFHVFFVCNDTHKTYHFSAPSPEGPWKWHEVEGFYHDCSVLFEDGRVFIVYGNRTIRLTELKADLTGPLPGGIDQVIVQDLPPEEMMLGYEGSHFYHIGSKYYLFLIHWPHNGRRTEAVFVSDSLTGPYHGRDILADDIGFHEQGVAQGGIIQGPDGIRYGLLFQDHGAVGRVPVLCDVTWEDDFPHFCVSDIPAPKDADIRQLYAREEAFTSPLSPMWQFNHQPDEDAASTGHDGLRLRLHPASDMEHARNTLTQRAFGPGCHVSVTVDGSALHEGGRAGLGVLQGCFAGIFIEKKNGAYHLCREERTAAGQFLKSQEPVTTTCLMPLPSSCLRLHMEMDFDDMHDTVRFFADVNGTLTPLGAPHKLQYRLDHFMGARIALYGYDTHEIGSCAIFRDYQCRIEKIEPMI